MKLSQSRGVLRIDSEILSDGVFYRERNLLSSNEVKIPRHQYGNRAAASIADEGESTPPLLH